MAGKGKTGPDSKYKPEYVNQAKLLYEGGFTDIKAAQFFKVSRGTIYAWQKEFPDFSAAIQAGKDYFDSKKTEKSLLKRATGFYYTEVTRESARVVVRGEKGVLLVNDEPKMVITKKVRKYVVPDTGAAIFWLKNRNSDRWKDAQQHEHMGQVTILKPEPINKKIKKPG